MWRCAVLRSRLALLVCLCAVLGVVSSGCSAQPSNGKLLEAHDWRVTKLLGATYSGTAPITATFSAGKLNGSTGVNVYNATYEAPKANDISIKLGATTQRAGTPAAMKAERDYMTALGSAVSYAVDDETLTMFDSSGVATVEYAVKVPVALVGTNWVMTSYNNGRGGFQSAEASAQVTAVFSADGTLHGSGGINQYSSTYKATATTIDIQPVVSTKMAGPDPLMTQEDAYFAALPKATIYAIEGDQLTLRDATGAAMAGYRAAK